MFYQPCLALTADRPPHDDRLIERMRVELQAIARDLRLALEQPPMPGGDEVRAAMARIEG